MACGCCSPVVPRGPGCRRHRAHCSQWGPNGTGRALSVPRAGRVGWVLPSTGIKTELDIKTEPEDDSYGDCCPREKEEPPDPAACEWGWAHGGACGRARGAPSAAPGPLPSAPAGDAKPEVIVKVEPEEEAYIGCPQGPGDPGAAGEHSGARTRLVSTSGCECDQTLSVISAQRL